MNRGVGPCVGALLIAALFAGEAALFAGGAAAQSLSPMRGEVRSLEDAFAVKLRVRNPYERTVGVEIRAYDRRFRPIRVLASATRLPVAAGDERTVTVLVPFGKRQQRRVRICAESLPFRAKPNATRVRTRICGRFLGKRF